MPLKENSDDMEQGLRGFKLIENEHGYEVSTLCAVCEEITGIPVTSNQPIQTPVTNNPPFKTFQEWSQRQTIEANKKQLPFARAANGNVAVKISNDGSVMYGRHFDHNGNIVSLLTRESIDALKQHFRDEMTDPDWRTCIKLKKLFDIQ